MFFVALSLLDALPSTLLPIGMRSLLDPHRLVRIPVTEKLVGSLLAVMQAETKEQLETAPVACFVHVYVAGCCVLGRGWKVRTHLGRFFRLCSYLLSTSLSVLMKVVRTH